MKQDYGYTQIFRRLLLLELVMFVTCGLDATPCMILPFFTGVATVNYNLYFLRDHVIYTSYVAL